MRKRVALPAAILAGTSTLLSAISAVPAMAEPAPATSMSQITWTPCPEDPTAECGTLAVPVDWANPGGPTVDLALARRKATDPAARIGSLPINPGVRAAPAWTSPCPARTISA